MLIEMQFKNKKDINLPLVYCGVNIKKKKFSTFENSIDVNKEGIKNITKNLCNRL